MKKNIKFIITFTFLMLSNFVHSATTGTEKMIQETRARSAALKHFCKVDSISSVAAPYPFDIELFKKAVVVTNEISTWESRPEVKEAYARLDINKERLDKFYLGIQMADGYFKLMNDRNQTAHVRGLVQQTYNTIKDNESAPDDYLASLLEIEKLGGYEQQKKLDALLDPLYKQIIYSIEATPAGLNGLPNVSKIDYLFTFGLNDCNSKLLTRRVSFYTQNVQKFTLHESQYIGSSIEKFMSNEKVNKSITVVDWIAERKGVTRPNYNELFMQAATKVVNREQPNFLKFVQEANRSDLDSIETKLFGGYDDYFSMSLLRKAFFQNEEIVSAIQNRYNAIKQQELIQENEKRTKEYIAKKNALALRVKNKSMPIAEDILRSYFEALVNIRKYTVVNEHSILPMGPAVLFSGMHPFSYDYQINNVACKAKGVQYKCSFHLVRNIVKGSAVWGGLAESFSKFFGVQTVEFDKSFTFKWVDGHLISDDMQSEIIAQKLDSEAAEAAWERERKQKAMDDCNDRNRENTSLFACQSI